MPCRGVAVSAEESGACRWVASAEDLALATRRWRGVVGLDTEFQRTDTYFPIPGLYQVVAGSDIWLLDPLAVGDWAGFVDVLEDDDTVKVVHACFEDLELLNRHLGVHPVNLFDTQLAAAFISENFSMSYAGLVEGFLGVTLSKHHTRSDWLKRPLSADQIRYAQEDVAYLIELHRLLSARLRAAGRWEWFLEDMRRREGYAPRAPSTYFTGVKKAWKLNGRQLAILKALCEWREQRAMAEDVPRNRVVWDEHLFQFAQRETMDLRGIRHTLPSRVARRYAEGLLNAFAAGLNAPPEPTLPKPLSTRQGGLLRRLRELGRERARELEIAPELLARQRDIEECVYHYRASGSLSETYLGWRWSVLGGDYVTELEKRG